MSAAATTTTTTTATYIVAGSSSITNAHATLTESARERDSAVLHAELLRTKQELRQVQDAFDEYTQSSVELEQELEQELSRAEKKNALLGARAQQFEFDLQTAREKLESTQQLANKYERELSGLRDELALVVDAKRQLEQEQDDLVTQVRILQATEDDLRHKMEREIEEKVFLVSDQEELEREHELAVERFRTEIVDLQSELYALQQKHDDDSQQMQLERLSATSSSTSNAALWNQMDVDSDGGERSRHASSTDDMDDNDYDDAFRRSTVHERDAVSQELLIESLRREIDVLSARAQEETDARERLEAELVQLQSSVAHVESMETEMMELTDEVIAKAQEIRKRDVEIQALQQQTTSLKMELAALTTANSDLSDASDELQSQLADKVAEAESLARALRDADERCNELAENEIRLVSQLESEVETVAMLKQQVKELSASVEDASQKRKDLETQIEASRSELCAHQRDLAASQSENAALRDQLESAAKKAAELERATSMSTASTSSTTSGGDDADAHRLVLEIQSLRAKLQSLHAENGRLRSQEGLSSDVAATKKVSANLLTLNYTGEQLARKYLAERTRNASLLSRLQTVCGNIQVFCRVRPVITEELQKAWGSRLAVNVINHSDVAVMDIKAERVFATDNGRTIDGSIDALALESLESSASWKVFTFDRILGPDETQNDVFREVEPIAQSVVEGFKACIFAYGQTGSGKTYTMEGTESDPGLNYRVVRHIFQSVQLRGSIYDPKSPVIVAGSSDDVEMVDSSLQLCAADDDDTNDNEDDTNGPCYHVQVGVLEIYNETLRDLIDVNNSKALEIRHESETGDIHVSDLTMASVSTPEQTIDVLRKAQANRITGQTNVHARSSRSHCVVVVQISTSTSAGNGNEARDEVCGKLYLVDLAGSESVKHSHATGDMLREAAHINKSLSALADVMEALDKKLPHVPYRNSKLTFLLQDVLNSSCKTVMIVNVGPTYETANESSRSLQLAERVRHIVVGRNSIVKNKKDILSAKRAFSEIQTLKQQLAIAARKSKQAQQSVVAMKREQKNQSEKQSATLQQRVKASEAQKTTYKSQNDTLKRLHDELSEQLKLEREARQRETDQREAAQRMLRQLTAKTRVSTSHTESLESLLKDREAEIRKLRHAVTEARQRSTAALIPRLGSPAVGRNGRTNQTNDNTSPVGARPHAKTLGSPATVAAGAPPAYQRKRNSSSFGSTRGGTKPRTEATDADSPVTHVAPTTGSSSAVSSSGGSSSSSSVLAAATASRTRRASSLRSMPSESSARIWK